MLVENTEPKGWRKHWFVKNVLSELPVVGSFFYTESISKMLHHAGKSTTMLVVGGLAMTYIPTSEEDNMATKTASMALGMAGGAVVFNGIYNAGKMIYEYRQYNNAKKEILASMTPIAEPPQQELINASDLRSDDISIIQGDSLFTDQAI